MIFCTSILYITIIYKILGMLERLTLALVLIDLIGALLLNSFRLSTLTWV